MNWHFVGLHLAAVQVAMWATRSNKFCPGTARQTTAQCLAAPLLFAPAIRCHAMANSGGVQ